MREDKYNVAVKLNQYGCGQVFGRISAANFGKKDQNWDESCIVCSDIFKWGLASSSKMMKCL